MKLSSKNRRDAKLFNEKFGPYHLVVQRRWYGWKATASPTLGYAFHSFTQAGIHRQAAREMARTWRRMKKHPPETITLNV